MYVVKGDIAKKFIADNQPAFSILIEELLANDILNLLKHEMRYSSFLPNYRTGTFFKEVFFYWSVLIIVDIIYLAD